MLISIQPKLSDINEGPDASTNLAPELTSFMDTQKKFMLTFVDRFQPRKRDRVAEHAVVDGENQASAPLERSPSSSWVNVWM